MSSTLIVIFISLFIMVITAIFGTYYSWKKQKKEDEVK